MLDLLIETGPLEFLDILEPTAEIRELCTRVARDRHEVRIILAGDAAAGAYEVIE